MTIYALPAKGNSAVFPVARLKVSVIHRSGDGVVTVSDDERMYLRRTADSPAIAIGMLVDAIVHRDRVDDDVAIASDDRAALLKWLKQSHWIGG